jgi:ComF family protein
MWSLRPARFAADAVLAIAFAPACAACARVLDSPLAGPVCPSCWSGVQLLGARDTGVPQPLSEWYAAGAFEGSLREIIHAFKYDGRRSLAAPLARLMREAGAAALGDADFVVPVPLHPWRRLRRGFNQADDLARLLEVPVCRALSRRRATRPQTDLDPAERHRNVRAAFGLSPFVRRSCLEGARVVIVDDVRTTGATLAACALVLEAAGAREVRAVTAARASMPSRQAARHVRTRRSA